ncbi:histidine kinase [Filimonas effusa]|uniref:MASE11 domain-containing protein n=1 Tax=Filimonas effusa TaxID=2508721 RepID=A0A4Q1DC34_9BACT|nr:hypothetical protein [Filimonas effusa]RXK87064.1 hypothetical protein ESB13_09845 [Filimonas effusa]
MMLLKERFNKPIARYSSFIREAMYERFEGDEHVFLYWQNDLFVQIIIWVLPVSFIALVPSMYFEVRDGYWPVALLDVLSLILIYGIALQRSINLYLRKVLVAVIIVVFCISLIVFMNALGLAGLYLFSLSVFMALLFTGRMAFAGLVVNVIACVLFSLFFYCRPELAAGYRFSLYTWGIYVSNYLFLNLVVVVLIRRLLGSIAQTMEKEWLLNRQLQEETAMKKQQGDKLREIAYLQSHVIRAPLVNIMGLAYLIRHSPGSQVEEEILDNLDESVLRLDEVIKNIVDHTT